MALNTKGPPDGGWGWMCVFGKMISHFFALGTATAFGIIYIDIIDYFNTTREKAAWIGSLSFGLTFLTGPFSSVLISRFGIQKTTAVGTLIAFSGCFISWFATSIPYLYVTYGVITGIGLGVTFVPSELIVIQYFEARVGLASALGSVGNGLGTVVLPHLYTYLLGEYGWRGTLLLLSGIILQGLICAVIFVQPPYLKESTMTSSYRTTKSKSCNTFINIFRSPCLMLYTAATGLGLFGYPVPFVHLPDMAVLAGIDKFQTAYLITIMGVSSIFGRLFFGWISDFECVNVVCLQGVSLIVCGVVTAVCPHLTEFYAFALYTVIYGTFIGVFTNIIAIVASGLAGIHRTGETIGIIFFVSGILITTSSPVAGWLFDTTETYNASFYLAGCSFFLAGVMTLTVMLLHKPKQKNENVSVLVVAQSQEIKDETNKSSNTFEQIRM